MFERMEHLAVHLEASWQPDMLSFVADGHEDLLLCPMQGAGLAQVPQQ